MLCVNTRHRRWPETSAGRDGLRSGRFTPARGIGTGPRLWGMPPPPQVHGCATAFPPPPPLRGLSPAACRPGRARSCRCGRMVKTTVRGTDRRPHAFQASPAPENVHRPETPPPLPPRACNMQAWASSKLPLWMVGMVTKTTDTGRFSASHACREERGKGGLTTGSERRPRRMASMSRLAPP